jgi:hypothetical protein
MPRKTNLCLAAAMTAALLAAGCGEAAAPSAAGRPGAAGAKAAPTAGPRPTPTPSPSPSLDPGTLPQTHTLPGVQDARFRAGVQALWQAIVQGKPELARSFFFPRSAYEQVKAISNPDEDYRNRLVAWYDLDIEAAHDHLGAKAPQARLVGMDVPEDAAEWIEPGAEYNKGSYYRVYGSRLNYQVGGHTASIGVFSLISWRGEWYVVHLGPSTRSATEGLVYNAWD